MSKEAEDIEHARRVYIASMGTAYEQQARRNLERVVERVKRGRLAN